MAKQKITCTSCGRTVVESNFYKTSSPLYKHYGRVSICRNCIIKMFDNYMKKYNDDFMKATYYTCRKLDVCFRLSDFEGALKQYENKNNKRKDTFFFGIYMTKLNSLGSVNHGQTDFDNSDELTTNDEKANVGEENINLVKNIDDVKIDLETQMFWGFGFETKDYVFLETEIAKWKQTHKCDNQAELTLLKEICIKILEIRNKREKGNSVSKEQKELQDLMKTASVDPAKSNSINSGENVDRFGVWLKDIERYKPSEWWENQEKYKDMDGFLPYIKNYIVRPIKNFFTGTKDFTINGEDLSFSEKEDDKNE